MSNQLEQFTPKGCNRPVALISHDIPEFIKDVITEKWMESSSGFGSHFTFDEFVDEQVQEYQEEYAQANAW